MPLNDKDKSYLWDIAHEYGEILEERIWATANDHIQPLIESNQKYL